MFQQPKNIDTAFRHIKWFSIVIVACSFLVLLFSLIENNRIARTSQQRIFILAGGKALEAFAADRKDNIPVEARDHIAAFHHYFFSLDPDQKVITANISKALYLADASAKKQYDNLKESGYYSEIVSGNISQQLEVDSIYFNMDSYPYYFKCMATEKITRLTSMVTRSLITEGWLRSVSRSDNNAHGFLIERWTVLENKDLKTEIR